MGKDLKEDDIEEQLRKKLKLQRLSFNDFNEEKSGLLSPCTPDFDIEAMKADIDYQDEK